jgi:hypothetical protein
MADNPSIDPRALDSAFVKGLYEDLHAQKDALQAETAKQKRAKNGKAIRDSESRIILIRAKTHRTLFLSAVPGKLKPLRSMVSSARKAIKCIGLDREYF